MSARRDAPVCAQCGRSGWSITVGGIPAAPLTLETIGSLGDSRTDHFCDTLCLLRWSVDQREKVVAFWRSSWEQSAGDVNHVLHGASLIDRILIGRWWSKRFDARAARREARS